MDWRAWPRGLRASATTCNAAFVGGVCGHGSAGGRRRRLQSERFAAVPGFGGDVRVSGRATPRAHERTLDRPGGGATRHRADHLVRDDAGLADAPASSRGYAARSGSVSPQCCGAPRRPASLPFSGSRPSGRTRDSHPSGRSRRRRELPSFLGLRDPRELSRPAMPLEPSRGTALDDSSFARSRPRGDESHGDRTAFACDRRDRGGRRHGGRGVRMDAHSRSDAPRSRRLGPQARYHDRALRMAGRSCRGGRGDP
jgi:hypothetical protein